MVTRLGDQRFLSQSVWQARKTGREVDCQRMQEGKYLVLHGKRLATVWLTHRKSFVTMRSQMIDDGDGRMCS